MLPFVILKCALSVDGYIDSASKKRLLLSDPADLDLADAVRASVDAIIVGANTIRSDNPRLTIRSPARQRARRERGWPIHPRKVTLTTSGQLKIKSHFFAGAQPLVYCPVKSLRRVQTSLRGAAEIVPAGQVVVDLKILLADLFSRGARRVLVEGGQKLASAFLLANLADELQVSIAPFFVGDEAAIKFLRPGSYPHGPNNRMTLRRVERVGDMAVITWGLAKSDNNFLTQAVELSLFCPPSQKAFSVGAIIVDRSGKVVADGYSRERSVAAHAEEVALTKAKQAKIDLKGGTLYSSLEPCGRRLSKKKSCVEYIIQAGLSRVVYVLKEPPIFVAPAGAEKLKAAGIIVKRIPQLASRVMKINQHLFDKSYA